MATFGITDNTSHPTSLYPNENGDTSTATIGSGGLLVTGGTLTAVRVWTGSVPGFRTVAFAVYQGGSLSGTNGDPTGATKIWDSGELTTTLAASNNLNAASKASQCVLTTTATPNCIVGDWVAVASVGGMTQLNSHTYEVVGVSGNNVTINVDSSAFSTYTSGGSICPLRWYQISASGTLASNTNTWLMIRGGNNRHFASAAASSFTSGTGSDNAADANQSSDAWEATWGSGSARDWPGSLNSTQQFVGAIVYTPTASIVQAAQLQRMLRVNQ